MQDLQVDDADADDDSHEIDATPPMRRPESERLRTFDRAAALRGRRLEELHLHLRRGRVIDLERRRAALNEVGDLVD